VKRLAVAAGFVTAAGLRNASAQPAIEDVHIEYRAPSACPTERWVLGRILGRTDRFRRVEGGLPGRIFSIDITQSGSSYSGTLEITETVPEPRSTARRIEATTCEDVADGLALIAALTIDPKARVEAPPEGPPQAVPPPSKERPPAPNPATPPRPPRSKSPSVPYLRLGAGFVGVSGVAPALLYGGEGFVEVGRANEKRWFSPALFLAFRYARHDSIVFAEGTAQFRLSTFAAGLCPLRAPIPTVGLSLCATGEVGWLDAEGSQAPNPQHSRRAWAALGSLLRASVSAHRIGVEASIGAEAPLRRDRFLFDSQVGGVELVVLSVGVAITGQID
jgi:hypothetical protein